MLELLYGYCSSGLSTTQCSINNGNVYWQTSSRSGTSWAQNYNTYDALNRLTSAKETGPGTSWTENFGYDSYANRWVSSAPGLPALSAQTPQAASWYNAKNQVTAWDYDTKGNLLDYGNSSTQYAYDIDNHMKTAAVNGTTTQYQYDGDGRRVQKIGTSSSTVAFGN